MTLACPSCGETDQLRGTPDSAGISVVCEVCRFQWVRDPSPSCPSCGEGDQFSAIAAVIEKGRGTQLSVVGTRIVHLCENCDAETIALYLGTRPNPLMPDQLPNASGEES